MPRCLLLLALAAVAPLMAALAPGAHAFEVERIEGAYADKQYRCTLVVTLDAPTQAVEAVLRDYEAYPALDARILSARVLARPSSDTVLLETRLRVCLGPFCRTVRRVETVTEAPLTLNALADPAQSDVRFGETSTTLEPIGDARTRIHYRARIVPGFWVPSVGGRRWLLRTLEDATLSLFRSVEARAQP
jgi:hypothetical protein